MRERVNESKYCKTFRVMKNTICARIQIDSHGMVPAGMRSRSRDRSWSRSELTILTGVGVGAGVGKIWEPPTPARSRKPTPPAADDSFERTVVHAPENID